MVTFYFVSLPYAIGKRDNSHRKKEFNSKGKVAYFDGSIDIGIYRDVDCTQILTYIEWGNLYVGGSVTFTAYIKNLDDVQTSLSMETSNWNPVEASNYMDLSWNYMNQDIKPNEIIPVTWTLTVSPNIKNVKTFNFDIIITSYN